MFRRVKPPRRRRSLKVICESIEILEDRTLLSGAPAAAVAAAGANQSGGGTANNPVDWNSLSAQTGGHCNKAPVASFSYSDNFDNGTANNIDVVSGTGGVVNGQYQISSQGSGGDAISLLQFSDPLPANVELTALIEANDVTTTELSNSFIIFDYQSPTDFKFAGAYAGVDQWVIGHRDDTGWNTDVYVDANLDAFTQYDLNVVIEDTGHVTLYSGGVARVSFIYNESLTDGGLGLATKNSTARYDDLSVTEYTGSPNAGALPLQETFDDGTAGNMVLQTGGATLTDGSYQLMAAPGLDGLSTVAVDGTLPADLQISATINANGGTSAFLSNAFIIFDYHSPTDFKWAGAYVGVDQWAIGHRDASGWVTDSWVGAKLDPYVDYSIQVNISSSGLVTLSAGGVEQVSFDYGTTLTDGSVGVGTKTAIARFDNIEISDPNAQAVTLFASTSTSTSDPTPTEHGQAFGLAIAAANYPTADERGNSDNTHRRSEFPPLL